MSEIRLLSGSDGKFWGVVDEGEWTGPLLLKNATVKRTQTRTSGTPVDVISSSGSSDDGEINTITILDVASNFGGGATVSNPSCAYFGFPVTKSDGTPVSLGGDSFTIDLFIEMTSTPGLTDNNKCYIILGVNDGDTDLDCCMGTGFAYTNTNQRIATFTLGSGKGLSGTENDINYIRATLMTTPSGSIPAYNNPFYAIDCFGYDGSDNSFEDEQRISGQTQFGTKFQSLGRPTGSTAHVFIGFGKQAASGQGDKQFSFKCYYKLSMRTFNDIPTERPG